MGKTKTFDCVEMKRQAQARLWAEFERRRDEFASYVDFINARVHESERTARVLERLKRGPQM